MVSWYMLRKIQKLVQDVKDTVVASFGTLSAVDSRITSIENQLNDVRTSFDDPNADEYGMIPVNALNDPDDELMYAVDTGSGNTISIFGRITQDGGSATLYYILSPVPPGDELGEVYFDRGVKKVQITVDGDSKFNLTVPTGLKYFILYVVDANVEFFYSINK